MLLLDQGLPRSTVARLSLSGIDSVHVGDIGLATAEDSAILDYARNHGQIVVTLDADFHARLARSGADRPSVVRVRIEGLRAEALAQLLVQILEQCGEDLKQGAVVSVTTSGIRLRRLPMLR